MQFLDALKYKTMKQQIREKKENRGLILSKTEHVMNSLFPCL